VLTTESITNELSREPTRDQLESNQRHEVNDQATSVFLVVMSGNKQLSISIQPLQYANVSTCARITAEAFSTDRHTIVKQLGGKPFDMFEVSRDGFLSTLHRKNYIYVKAVDDTGEIVGHAGWGFRGVDDIKIPWEGPSDKLPLSKLSNPDKEKGDETKTTAQETMNGDGIERLHALEDADMNQMMSELMPPGTSCMYFVGLTVAPPYKSQGIGSTLIKYGAAIADPLDIFTWVHASDQSWRAYAKFGFEVVKELVIDLDEYAPKIPGQNWAIFLEGTCEGVTEKNWGSYAIRYMKRMPPVAGA